MENHQFKVEGVIWKLVEGKIVEVKIDNEIFIKKSSLVKPPTVKTPFKESGEYAVEPAKEIVEEIDLDKKPLFEELDRGEALAKNIHKNILHGVIQAIKEGKNQDKIKQIISKYHPGVTKESIATYTSNYKKYIIENYPELKSMLPSRQYKKKFEEKIEEIEQPEDKKGKTIARLGHNTVFEWPLRAFKKAFKEERGRSYLEGIIQFYYDTNNISSINTYLSCYRRYINKTYKEIDLKEINEFDESEDLYKLLPPLEKFLYISTTKSKEQLPERYDEIKGRCIGHIGSHSIYENILTDIKTAIIENKTKNQIMYNILRHYHPKISKKSRITYYRAYIRWIHQEEKSPVRALSFERKKKKPVKHDDDVGFDESYKRMVSKDEIKKVKKAIMHVELNYEPTTKNIAMQTGFTEHSVRGTLHWMIDNNLVEMKYNENLIPTYAIIYPNGS